MSSALGMIAHSQPTIEPDDLDGVNRVLLSRHLAQGCEVQQFEDEVAQILGLPGGVATSSGTAALHLALRALGVGAGAEVLIPSYTCVALLHAVDLVGATPRIVDCGPHDVNMGMDAAGRLISPATRAVILPHMFGRIAPVEAFRALGIPIIENCAHALGGSGGARPAGSVGDVTVLSFYATKMITTGEGGMLLSQSESALAEARDLRDYDNRAGYRLRYNYKMTDVQAALGRSQLRKLSRFVDRRRAIAHLYHAALDGVVPTYTPPRDGDVFYRYVIGVPDPERFIADTLERGVECKRPVYRPLHEFLAAAPCPNAAAVHRRAVSVPIYPSLSDDEVHAVSAQMRLGAERQGTRSVPRASEASPLDRRV